ELAAVPHHALADDDDGGDEHELDVRAHERFLPGVLRHAALGLDLLEDRRLLQLQETPIFEEIKAKGGKTKNPWKEAFMSANIKFVLIASIIVIGEGVVWYSGQF